MQYKMARGKEYRARICYKEVKEKEGSIVIGKFKFDS